MESIENLSTGGKKLILATYSDQEVRAAFITFVKNRKKNDKHALAYMIDMIKDYYAPTFAEFYTRDELLSTLISMIENSPWKATTLLRSEYTRNEVLSILTK